MRTTRIMLALGLVAVLAAAGCGDDDDTVGTGDDNGGNGGGGTSISLDEQAFVAESITVDGSPRAIVDGSEIVLTFADGRLGVQAGCNSMSGGYSIDGETLTVEPMASTNMACADDLMDQDAFVADFFSGPVAVTLEGSDLTLERDGTTIALTEQQPEPDAALTGTMWTLESIANLDTQSVSTPGVDKPPTMKITDAGEVEMFFGCNSGSGDVEVGDTTLTFGPMMMTRMACPDPQMQVERTVVTVLDGEVEYAIEGSRLTTTKGSDSLAWIAATS